MAISARVAFSTTALAFSAALVLAGCSSGGGGQAGGGASPSTTKTTSGTPVTVTETEYALKLSRTSFTPGTYTFTADNAGKVTHAMEIDGPGVSDVKTNNIGGGQQAALTVTLKKGTYELYCPVDSHKSLGMDQHIEVR